MNKAVSWNPSRRHASRAINDLKDAQSSGLNNAALPPNSFRHQVVPNKCWRRRAAHALTRTFLAALSVHGAPSSIAGKRPVSQCALGADGAGDGW